MTTDIRRFEGESYLDFKKRYLASLAGEAVPEVVKDVAGSGMQGAKVVGSKFMDILNELDRPRGFGAGIWDELSPGAGDNVMDTRSFGQRLLEGGIEGWKDPSSKSYGDEFTSYYP